MSAVTESILDSTKAALGIVPSYNAFDDQVIMYINTAFSTLHQIGLGPDDGFEIVDSTTTWGDYLEGNKVLNMVKTYVHISVRLMFDPPSNSFATDALKQKLAELEWRINVQVDPNVSAVSYG